MDSKRRALSKMSAGLILAVIVLASCGGSGSPAASTSGSDDGGAETTWERVQRTKVVRLGLSNEPPFSEMNEDGTVSGEAPEVLRAALEPYGIELEPVVTEFGALIPGLLADRFDVIAAGTAITPERCEQITFGNPDSVVQDGLIVLAGNPKDLHSYDDIAASPDAIIGIQAGSVYFDYAEAAGVPEDRVLTFTDISQAPNALTAGRVDAFATPRLTAIEIINNLPDPEIELADPFTQPVDAEGNPTQLYLALGFRNEDTDFIDAYNARLAEMTESGELLEITEPFGFDVLPEPDVTAEELCSG